MKKLVPILTFAALVSLASCKKKEEAPKTGETTAVTASAPTNVAAAPTADDASLKDAQSRPLTTIALSEPGFDFGKIKKGKTVEHTYEITNTGDKPLVISSVKPGCGCTVPEYTKDPILPGQKGKITLKFDSTNFGGVVNKYAQVYANIEKAPITITFTADIQP